MAKADIEFFQKLREHPPPEIKSKDKHHYFTTMTTKVDGEDELNVEKMNQEESQVVSLDEEIEELAEEAMQDLSINEVELLVAMEQEQAVQEEGVQESG
jgi:4-diphosphocytidyl-2C-methyl-D-erythritol kinase